VTNLLLWVLRIAFSTNLPERDQLRSQALSPLPPFRWPAATKVFLATTSGRQRRESLGARLERDLTETSLLGARPPRIVNFTCHFYLLRPFNIVCVCCLILFEVSVLFSFACSVRSTFVCVTMRLTFVACTRLTLILYSCSELYFARCCALKRTGTFASESKGMCSF